MSDRAVQEHEAFRHALASFATGVTVVTCLQDDLDHAMTASAVTSVSLSPPLVLVCVAHTARFNAAILSVEKWGVSVLSQGARPHATWLATSGRPLLGQLDRVPHTRSTHGYALLDQAVAWLECTTDQVVTAGDHDIVIGRVDAARTRAQEHPLLYYRARYGDFK